MKINPIQFLRAELRVWAACVAVAFFAWRDWREVQLAKRHGRRTGGAFKF